MLLLKRRTFGALLTAAALAVGSAAGHAAPTEPVAAPAAVWTGWSQVPGGGATPDAPGAATYQG
ncbi:hypothetical protein, partial [Priestia megaterium]|uniref:hypothetical protein n=1 Tax=Priestia megaterium TaxID=1404 RepID=UPI0035B58322